MGADTFIVFYGVRETVPCDEASIDALDEGDHPLLSLPRTSGLDCWTGRLTDGSDYHILLGKRIGDFGHQGQHEASISADGLQAMVAKVDALLSEHEVKGTRAFHFQFEAQY